MVLASRAPSAAESAATLLWDRKPVVGGWAPAPEPTGLAAAAVLTSLGVGRDLYLLMGAGFKDKLSCWAASDMLPLPRRPLK